MKNVPVFSFVPGRANINLHTPMQTGEFMIYCRNDIEKLGWVRPTTCEGITPFEAFSGRYIDKSSLKTRDIWVEYDPEMFLIFDSKFFPSKKDLDKQFVTFLIQSMSGVRKANANENSESLIGASLHWAKILELAGVWCGQKDFQEGKKPFTPYCFQKTLLNQALDYYHAGVREVLISSFTGSGKTTLVPQVVVEISKPGDFCLFTTPILDTMNGLVESVRQNWYEKKLWIFTKEDFDDPDFEDRLLRKSRDGFIVILALSVQGLRNQSGSDSEVIALSKRYADMFSWLKFRLWIRDERHSQYEGRVTKQAFAEFEKLQVEKILDTTATPYNLLELECYKNVKMVNFTYLDVLKQKAAGNLEFQDFPDLSLEVFNTVPVTLTQFSSLYSKEEGWDPRKLFSVDNGQFVHRQAILELINATLQNPMSKSKNMLSICSDPALLIPEPRVGMMVIAEGDSENSTQVRGEMLAHLLNKNSSQSLFITASTILDQANRTEKKVSDEIDKLIETHNKQIVIITHRQLTTGSDIPQLGWILLLDKISSIIEFTQLIGRMTRKYPEKKAVKIYIAQPGMDVAVLHHKIIDAQARKDGVPMTSEMFDLLPLTLYDGQIPKTMTFQESQRIYDEYLNRICAGEYRPAYFKAFNLEALFDLFGNPLEVIKSMPELRMELTEENGAKVKKIMTRLAWLTREKIEPIGKDKKNADWLENFATMMKESNHIGMISKCEELICVFQTEMAKEMFGIYNCEVMLGVLSLCEPLRRISSDKYKNEMEDLMRIPVLDRLERMFKNEPYKIGMGLVYTPRALIQEMLDTLPNFSDRRLLRILVPNALDGKIPLMLNEKYPNHKLEIICLEYFPFYIKWLKSLGFEVKKCWSIKDGKKILDFKEVEGMLFDLIITNPPYQNSGKTRGNKFWYKFIFECEQLLSPNGYLAMVTPSSWMTGGNNLGNRGVIRDLFSEKQLVSATVAGVTEQHFPKIGLNISWWILRNTPNIKPSKIVLRDGEVSISIEKSTCLSSIPTKISNSILLKVISSNQDKFEVDYFQTKFEKNPKPEKSKSDEKFNVPHWVMGSDKTNDLCFTYLDHTHYDKLKFRKILIPMGSRYWQPYFDEIGVSVVSQGFSFKVKSEWNREGIYSVFYSNLFTYICKTLQIDYNGFMKTPIVRSLPKLDMSRIWTDQELYDHFGLTQEEQVYIESIVK